MSQFKNAPSEKMKALNPEKVVFNGLIHDVVQQEVMTEGRVQTFEIVRRAPGTRLIIVSPEEKILITREYRHESDSYDYRLPGGKVFNKLEDYQAYLASGKNIEEKAMLSAKAEAKEEAGVEVKDLQLYKKTHCGATIQWDLYYFVATDYSILKSGQELGHGEDIQVLWFTKEEVKKKCLKGEIKEDRSVAVLLQYLA